VPASVGFLWSALCRRPWRTLCWAGLLLLLGLAGYAGWHYARARYLEPRAHFAAAERDLEQLAFPDALAHLRLCAQAWPDDLPTHFLLARTARRAGHFAEAEEELVLCERLQAEQPSTRPVATRLEWALLEAQRGRLVAVEGYLRGRLRDEDPDSLLILETLSWELMRGNRLREAWTFLNLWLQQKPDDYEAMVRRGWVAEHLFDFAAALQDYGHALAIDPRQDNVRQRLAELLVDKKRAAEALEHLEILRQHQPENPAVLVCYARCQHLLGKVQEATRLVDAVLKQDPRNARALGERGLLALEADQPTLAERLLRQAVDLDPSNGVLIYNLHHCLERLGKHAEAKQALARLNETAVELQRMEQFTQQVMHKPHDPSLRYEVGKIFLRNGFIKEGLYWLDTALTEDPRHRPTHEALADFFERQGNREQAAYHRRFVTQPEASRRPSS
jgi:tetratricopeptide (TPR) repeat protein